MKKNKISIELELQSPITHKILIMLDHNLRSKEVDDEKKLIEKIEEGNKPDKKETKKKVAKKKAPELEIVSDPKTEVEKDDDPEAEVVEIGRDVTPGNGYAARGAALHPCGNGTRHGRGAVRAMREGAALEPTGAVVEYRAHIPTASRLPMPISSLWTIACRWCGEGG
jgi:hypothetical protein